MLRHVNYGPLIRTIRHLSPSRWLRLETARRALSVWGFRSDRITTPQVNTLLSSAGQPNLTSLFMAIKVKWVHSNFLEMRERNRENKGVLMLAHRDSSEIENV